MSQQKESSKQSFELYREWGKPEVVKPEVVKTGWNYIYKSNAIGIRYRKSEDDNHELLAFKYMPYSRLMSSIEESEFVFVSPTKWRDPFETLLFRENGVLNDGKYDVTATCFAQNDFKNEEGLWHFTPFASNDNNDPTVRVAFKMKNLLGQLDQYANNNNSFDFYLSMVKYVESSEIIEQREIAVNNIEDYINDLSLKRVAFQHEIELRLFCAHKLSENEDINQTGGITKITGIDMATAIHHVTLPPIEPMHNGRHLCKHCYHKALINSNSDKRDKLKEKGIDVRYSSLYDVLEIEDKKNKK